MARPGITHIQIGLTLNYKASMGIGATEFTALPVVRQKINSTFPKPIDRVEEDLQASQISDRQALIGMAGDYLCAFWLCRFTGCSWPGFSKGRSITTESVEKRLESAQEDIERYLKNGIMSRGTIEAALCLAQRANYLEQRHQHWVKYKIERTADPADGPKDTVIGDFGVDEIADLRNLFKVLHELEPLTGSEIVLWPAFYWREDLLAGIGDFLVDGVLLDVKTTEDPTWTPAYWRQLVTYYLINDIHRELTVADVYKREKTPAYDIEEIGVYFARYGVVKSVPTTRLIRDQEKYQRFRAWFTNKAIEVNGDGNRNYDDIREVLCNPYSYQHQTSLSDFHQN